MEYTSYLFIRMNYTTGELFANEKFGCELSGVERFQRISYPRCLVHLWENFFLFVRGRHMIIDLAESLK